MSPTVPINSGIEYRIQEFIVVPQTASFDAYIKGIGGIDRCNQNVSSHSSSNTATKVPFDISFNGLHHYQEDMGRSRCLPPIKDAKKCNKGLNARCFQEYHDLQ